MLSKIDRWSLVFRAGLIFKELTLESYQEPEIVANLLLLSVECMDEYLDKIPDWQIIIRNKNLLKAGAIYRELAIANTKKGEKDIAANYHLLASRSFSLLKIELDDWQKDTRDNNPLRAGALYRELAIQSINEGNKSEAANFHLLASDAFEKATINLKLADWQEDVRVNNPLRAGALYRELAIASLQNKDELQAAKYYLSASICFAKSKNVSLAEWQIDIRDKNPIRASDIYSKYIQASENSLNFPELIKLKIAKYFAKVRFISTEKKDSYYSEFFESYRLNYLKTEKIDLTDLEILRQEIIDYCIDDIEEFIDFSFDCLLLYVAYGYEAEACQYLHQIYLYLYERLNSHIQQLPTNYQTVESEFDRILEKVVSFSKEFVKHFPISVSKSANIGTILRYKSASINVLSKGYKKLSGLLLLVAYYLSNDLDDVNITDLTLRENKKKNNKKNKPLNIIVRPHQFGAKSTFFDTQYLLAAVESVLNNSPENSRVFLIVNDTFKISKVIDDRLFLVSFDEIADRDYFDFMSKYTHLSTNHLEFEMFSIASYFLIKSVCELYSIDDFLIVEGDTLVFRPLESFIDNFKNSYYLSNFETTCFGRLGKDLIDHYCQVVMDAYTNDCLLQTMKDLYNTIQSNQMMGGISDMIFWNWIHNNIYNLNAGFSWTRCDQVTNSTICDHFFHKNDKPYKEERGINVDLLLHDYQVSINGEQQVLVGKKMICITNEDGDTELYYVDNKLNKKEYIQVNTAQFGGIYKHVMVELWNSLIAKNKFISYSSSTPKKCSYDFMFVD